MTKRAPVLLVLIALSACRKEQPQVTPAPEIRVSPEGFKSVRAHNGDAPTAMTASVWITERAVHMSPDAPALLTVPSGAFDFAPSDKRDGKAFDLRLPKLQDALFEKHGDAGGSLLVHLDARATFRMFVDVLFTSAQSGFTRAVVAVDDGKVIPLTYPKPRVQLPKLKALGDDAAATPELDMHVTPTVVAVTDGFVIKSAGGSLAEGCDHIGPGVTIRGHDGKALGGCLAKVRAAVADYAHEKGITFTANPNIAMQVLADGWTAARAEGFTEISTAVPF